MKYINKFLLLLLLFVYFGCSGGGGGSDISITKDNYSLNYSNDLREISGNIAIDLNFKADDIKTQDVYINNFRVQVPKCEILSQEFSFNKLSLNGDNNESVINLNIKFEKPCFSEEIIFIADKTYTYIGIDGDIIKESKNSEVYQKYELKSEIEALNKSSFESLALVYKETKYKAPFFVNSYILTIFTNENTPLIGEIKDIGVITDVKFISDNASLNQNEFKVDNIMQNINRGDKVVVIPNSINNDFEYLGSYEIDSIGDKNISVKRVSIKEYTNLSLIIGDESRINRCNATPSTANFKPKDSDFNVRSQIELELIYEPYLVGKDVVMYLNLEINGEIKGISLKENLKGMGLESVNFTCDNSEANEEDNKTEPEFCYFNDNYVYLKEANVLAQDIKANVSCVREEGCSYDYMDISDIGCDGLVNINMRIGEGDSSIVTMIEVLGENSLIKEKEEEE